MSDQIFHSHQERLRSGASNNFSLATVPEWIERNTKSPKDLTEPYSFLDHEYQLQILKDLSPEKVVRKCSQIGISELSVREVLAIARIIDGMTAIYTLPTANFASTFVKTRVDPIIAASEELRLAVNPNLDNSEIKQLGNSFLHFKGTIGAAAAISVPSDLNVHDEFDFSDLGVLTTYESRLTHSKYKMRREFSTPTLDDFGISASFKRSRRHWNLCKCHHCNEWFLPNYFDHVKIPGYDGDLRHITKHNIHVYRWEEAFLVCPKCGKSPELGPEHRNWVLENPTESHAATGYQIQPFDAPEIITPAYLVNRSTKYKRYADFTNFNLGLPAQDDDNALSKQEIEKIHVPGNFPGGMICCMGADMGLTNHITIGFKDYLGKRYVVHRERVPLADFEKRKRELAIQYRVAVTVMDSQPYVDLVMRLQNTDPNLYGAVYTNSKNVTTFTVKEQEEEPEEGKLPIRQVLINRNKAFDDLMSTVRRNEYAIKSDEKEDETFVQHCTDMKRIQKFDQDGEMHYVWVKSTDGQDHYFHSLLYLHTAMDMAGVATHTTSMPTLVRSFKQTRKL